MLKVDQPQSLTKFSVEFLYDFQQTTERHKLLKNNRNGIKETFHNTKLCSILEEEGLTLEKSIDFDLKSKFFQNNFPEVFQEFTVLKNLEKDPRNIRDYFSF